jgi:hypothetical protein
MPEYQFDFVVDATDGIAATALMLQLRQIIEQYGCILGGGVYRIENPEEMEDGDDGQAKKGA